MLGLQSLISKIVSPVGNLVLLFGAWYKVHASRHDLHMNHWSALSATTASCSKKSDSVLNLLMHRMELGMADSFCLPLPPLRLSLSPLRSVILLIIGCEQAFRAINSVY